LKYSNISISHLGLSLDFSYRQYDLFGFNPQKSYNYHIEKIEDFHDAIDELRDFLTEYHKLKEYAK